MENQENGYTVATPAYYERAIEFQKKKILLQSQEITKMTRVYTRDVRTTKIGDALKFLYQVIINKISK